MLPVAQDARSVLGPDVPPATRDPLHAAHDFLSRLTRPSIVLVALSGGSDSTGLLIALHHALRSTPFQYPHRLVACTVDHALRSGSAEEAGRVALRCQALDIPHRIARWSHSGIASGVQAQARLARYTLLLEAAQAFGADVVVTGHSADDQAETVAMRALRGIAGDAPGLAGMADATLFDRRLWICRPFLALRRQAVRDFLRAQGEGWIDDPSNDDARFERIRLRRAGPPPVSDAASRDRLDAGRVVAGMLADHVRVHRALVAEISLSDIDVADPHARRMLTILAATLGGKPHGMGRETALRLFATLGDGTPGAMTAGSVVFERRGGRLFLYRERRNLPTVEIAAGQTRVWDGRFAVENRGPAVATIGPGGGDGLVDRLVADGVPGGVAGRVAAAAPGIPASIRAASLSLTPVIAPYDTFLPRFDLMIADSVAGHLDRAPFPPCPVDVMSRK